MSLISLHNCGNCAHMHQQGDAMVCRFNPPVAAPIIVMTPKGPQILGWTGSFPPVDADSRCSKHARRIEMAKAS